MKPAAVMNNDRTGDAPKKKKGIPCDPDPDAEVIAMSPRSLQATNRFTCEVCSKGFQRDQNLQLHRRGHNLPWNLKQRPKSSEPLRRKVYVCPEPTCAHHNPSRALGDLTGIKKHFSRKHGEKRWKCDRCEKKYAVRSDWKAHSKVCGNREYKCDCGTVFSRRDSFTTHRAFCDALTRKSMLKSFASSPPPSSSAPQPFATLDNAIFSPPMTHPHIFNPSNGFPPPPPPLSVMKPEPEDVHLPTTLAAPVHESFMLRDASTSMTAMMMMNSIAASGAGTSLDDEGGLEGILGMIGDDHHVDGNLGMTRDFLSLSRDLIGMHGDDNDDGDDISRMQKHPHKIGEDDDVHRYHHRQQQLLWQG